MKFRKPFKIARVTEILGNLTEGTFLERENRFTAKVRVNSAHERAHISDTGKLTGILLPGRKVLLAENPKGSLSFKLIAVKAEDGWVFLYTPLHSLIAEKLIKLGVLGFKPGKVEREVRIEKSRIDFLVDGNYFVEVKGCTLLSGNICLFPSAKTSRGTRHLKTLVDLKEKGSRAGILFLAFRNCSCLSPNRAEDPEFANTFSKALSKGISYFGAKLSFSPADGTIVFEDFLPLCKQVYTDLSLT